MTAEQIEFDCERASQYDLDIRKAIPGYEALHSMAQSLLETTLPLSANLLVIAKTKAEHNFETSINNSIYFVSETRIVDLLNMAGFNNVTKFYNAFLFGGWTAQFTGN